MARVTAKRRQNRDTVTKKWLGLRQTFCGLEYFNFPWLCHPGSPKAGNRGHPADSVKSFWDLFTGTNFLFSGIQAFSARFL